mmetsp:Transcript_14241/g.41986  ORF Transcript_14241/g.41986 Transcript_14241/m.41986 type:complete len:257 (-) Transcript_14241:717-1487(-)
MERRKVTEGSKWTSGSRPRSEGKERMMRAMSRREISRSSRYWTTGTMREATSRSRMIGKDWTTTGMSSTLSRPTWSARKASRGVNSSRMSRLRTCGKARRTTGRSTTPRLRRKSTTGTICDSTSTARSQGAWRSRGLSSSGEMPTSGPVSAAARRPMLCSSWRSRAGQRMRVRTRDLPWSPYCASALKKASMSPVLRRRNAGRARLRRRRSYRRRASMRVSSCTTSPDLRADLQVARAGKVCTMVRRSPGRNPRFR